MMPVLEAELKNWHQWGFDTQPRLIKIFNTGKNHHTALLESNDKFYVIKRHKHAAQHAINAQLFAAKKHLAPRIIYHDNHIVIMDYLEGGLPTLSQTAVSLRCLHQQSSWLERDIDFKPTQLTLLDDYNLYLANVPESFQKKHESLLPLLTEFIADPTVHCFCHNDLVNENCLSLNNNAIFIDWEYAALNNPWFDIAAIVLYRNLSVAQSADFLNVYAGWQHKVNDRIFVTSQISLLWADLLWHTYKYGPIYKHQNAQRLMQLEQLVRSLK